ncbi:MAG: cell wall-binding repeat-containing protein [Candidatus Thermoplasmatota archaeon]|nr:cell wall-binding repeat-containing protein [Candidatus Thermoplasmatota archaeon]
MMGNETRTWRTLLITLVVIALISPLSGQVASSGEKLPEGYEGVSYRQMTPINKVTLVDHDRDGINDDLAYLAAVPASVFHSSSDQRVLMNPVLFYEPPIETSDEERVQNTYPAVNYLMEDLITVADGELDRLELIGFDGSTPGDVGGTWKAASIDHIDGDDPFTTASSIALENWEYSNEAVIAVIDHEPADIDEVISGELSGKTPDAVPKSGSETGETEPSPVDPNTHSFTIEPDYKYITSQLTWGQDWNPLSDITERGKDPDLQLYDMQLGMVGASEKWNVLEGASEEIDSYIYNSGEWEFAVTYMPTENSLVHQDDPESWSAVPEPKDVTPTQRDQWKKDRILGVMQDRIESGLNPDAPFDSNIKYVIDYTIYPGIDVPQRISTPFYCRDAKFTLEWSDNSVDLGLILRGPEGAEIAVATSPTSGTTQILEVPELGEGEYQASVVKLGGGSGSTEFSVSYEFHQMKERWEGTSWAGAANGAVIASAINAPLLFTSKMGLSGKTGDALNTLGVKKIYVIDIDSHGSKGIYDDIDHLRGWIMPDIEVEKLTRFEEVYDMVKEETRVGNEITDDIVFSTINPWTSWDVLQGRDASGNPGKEFEGALFVGPAALAAAYHGAPVFITDVHSEFSSAQAWHNEFWRYAYHNNRAPPSVACMVLTAKSTYKLIDRYGFDRKAPVDEDGKAKESIITVADQFDIGSSWDRGFVGGADAGRIMGTPVDTSVWVSRNGLYPKIIFANPAVDKTLDPTDGMRIQGSRSTRGILGNLVIETPEREEKVDFPVVQSWVSYQYKFNEQASEYWGCPYTTRTGITPYFDMSDASTDPDGIDPDGRYPDLDSSEVIPHYLEAAGYDNVFSTTFETTTENLNRGAIMWLEVMHGGHTYSGVIGWWNEVGAKEPEPWRGYEEMGIPTGTSTMRLRGATDDPDVVTMSKNVGLDITPGFGPISGVGIIPERHDGVIIAIAQQGQTEYSENGLVMDKEFGNLHSMGFSGGSCLIANTYLHLMMVRHGSIFQVIDPWLTSWYSAFAMNMFVRDIYYGRTVGDAYERGISHVGIEYLVDGWWWDIFENLVYYGDPDTKVFSPQHAWGEPDALKKDAVIDGHSPFGSSGHPNSMGTGLVYDILIMTGLIGLIGAGAYIYYRHRKGLSVPGIDRILKYRTSS